MLIVGPGILGGIVIALFFITRQRKSRNRAPDDPFELEPLQTDVINMARIRVSGVGGLGLVAMAAVVALAVPSIGQSLALGLVLGAVFAALLIAGRSRHGAMPSSGQRTGANTMLSIDASASVADVEDHDGGNVRRHRVAHVPS